MAKICPLFSGSAGNSLYISSGGEAILIDAGKSAKQLELSMKENNLDTDIIRAIFVTHEHSDHIQGLRVFASRHKIKVYTSAGTAEVLKYKGVIDGSFPVEIIKSAGEIFTAGMKVKAFETSHDSAESLGFVVTTSDDKTVGIATDLGFVSQTVQKAMTGCDAIVFEANHDVSMLQNGSYPYYLKRRILSSTGHLSNSECAKFLSEFLKTNTTRFLLAHLSRENNMEVLAYETVLEALQANGGRNNIDFLLKVAPQRNSGGHTVII